MVSPVSQAAINASLRRLGSPNRLVLNLMGDGEKSALDESPMGLSLWAAHLEESKIYLKDSLFAGDNLPPEAWAAHALLLAGPRRPLGEEREKALMDYLSKGGKLIILQDPMVVGFRAASLSGLGIDMPWGLAVDPDATWAGTEDFFIVSRDFPAHPVTMGLVQPVVWPLAGALVATNPASGPASESGDLESGSDSLNAAEAQNLASSDKNSETPMNSASDASPDSGKIAASEKASASVEPNASVNPSASVNPTSAENAAALDQADSGDPPSHTWSVALSSDAAWLETDRISLSERNHRYQAKIDLPGPLTLASATTVAGGGRLVLAADADLASNAFIVYAGNMAFLDNALYWLMGAQEELYSSAPIHWLDLTYAKARILFWLPTVVWPVLALIVWLRRYLGRRRQTA